MTSSTLLEALRSERGVLDRASTARRVADVLRDHVTEGDLAPGTRLSEEDLAQALGVSRNTLREAFRLLAHERLLVHEFNRGVFVRRLTGDDVRDLYRMRRILECGAIRLAGRSGAAEDPDRVLAVRAAVEAGERAADDGRWRDVGTANMQFHQALCALAESPRADEVMRHLTAELRLVFHVMARPRTFHERYLRLNRRLLELLAAGDLTTLETELERYLDQAEEQLVAAYSERA
jgi:DNA-binding GntR family transcriptional regulator